MFETVMWATDGSDASQRALPFALTLAQRPGAKLVVLHVRELLVGGRATGQPVYVDEDETQVAIARQVDQLREEGFHVTLKFVTSVEANAGHAIAETAARMGASVIVVGTRGRGPLAGVILGSVAQRLLHVAECPVLAVPPGAPVAKPESERELAAPTS
jgi:nucleotide-binding universal stress UspA family protein